MTSKQTVPLIIKTLITVGNNDSISRGKVGPAPIK